MSVGRRIEAGDMRRVQAVAENLERCEPLLWQLDTMASGGVVSVAAVPGESPYLPECGRDFDRLADWQWECVGATDHTVFFCLADESRRMAGRLFHALREVIAESDAKNGKSAADEGDA